MPYLASLFESVCGLSSANEEKMAKGRMQDVRSHATHVPVTCQIWLTVQNSTLLHSFERVHMLCVTEAVTNQQNIATIL